MIVNCLPLYEPPPLLPMKEESPDESSDNSCPQSDEEPNSNEASPVRAKKSFSLIKARSAEALDTVAVELELHDRDREDSKSDSEGYGGSVAMAPRKWSRLSTALSKNLMVRVHSVPEVERKTTSERARGEQAKEGKEELKGTTGSGEEVVVPSSPKKEAEMESVPKVQETPVLEGQEEEEVLKENPEEEEEERDLEGREEEPAAKESSLHDVAKEDEVREKPVPEPNVENPRVSDPNIENPIPQVPESNNIETSGPTCKIETKPSPSHSKKKLRNIKSSSPIDDPDNGSDGETDTRLSVNYLDTVTMSTMKRSSGSVSFYHRNQLPGRSSRLEASIEEGEAGTSSPGIDDILPPTVEEEKEEEKEETIVAQPSAASSSSLPPNGPLPPDTPPQASPVVTLTPVVLPVPPPTVDMEYVERSGWLNKLSHRRGMFGDKWQKRYFVLHRSWLYYFKKYGVSELPS